MPGVEPANPYSTRSQNSSSAPRPNYAEDQLLDTEPELEVLQVPSRDVALRTDSIHGSLSLETLSPSTAPNTHSGRHEHPKPPSTSEPVAIESVDRSGSYERAETLPKKRRASAQFLTMNTLIRAPGFSSTTPRINRSTYTNVVFASNAATLKSGKLQADENITYALNGEFGLPLRNCASFVSSV